MIVTVGEDERNDIALSKVVVEGRSTVTIESATGGKSYLFVFNPDSSCMGSYTLYTAFNILR